MARGRPRTDPGRSAVSLFVKYVLFFVNFLFILIGLSLAIVGAYVLYLKEKKVRTPIDFFFDPSCLMCLAGCIAFFLAFFGCAGSLRENTTFLKIYFYLVGLFLFLELALIIFVFVFYYVPDARTTLKLYPEDVLREAIVKYRDDDDMKNLIDVMQQTLLCCGLSNDDKGYLDWNLNVYFNCTDGNKSPESCAVPFSCCNIKSGDKINILCGGGALKEQDASAQLTSRIYTQGCLKGVQTFLDGSALIIGGVCIGILLPQALFVCLARMLKDQILEQKSKWARS
ncbi:tetraspanin-5-like [Haliotis cracherodii]|uniref:tetraspanin-5-like n=1 Tax=Haliotis cracherodii TaxID=6455 RepID=UPI0039EB134A